MMALSSQLRTTRSNMNNPGNKVLPRQNAELKRRIKAKENELEGERRRNSVQEVNPWRTPSPEEESFPRETVTRCLDAQVAQVVDSGKERKVVGLFDQEIKEEGGVPFMAKIRVVRWAHGIGRVEIALREAGVEFYEGTRWLVLEEELEQRRKRSSLESTVLVRVRGKSWVCQLDRAGIWVPGYWCSVGYFVAQQPKRKVRGRRGYGIS